MNTTKRLWLRLVIPAILAISGAAYATGASADLLGDIKARGKLICGTQSAALRFSFQNPVTHKLDGYEVDLCTALAKSLSVDIDMETLTTEQRIVALQQGRVDILAALMTYLPDRAKILDYSTAYYKEPFKIMVRKDSGITDFAGLAHARIGNIKGSSLEPVVLQKFPDSTMISYDDEAQVFLALEQGKVVAMAAGQTNLRGYQEKAGEANYVILSQPLDFSTVGFAMRKGDPDLVAAVDKFLTEYEASGQGAALYQKFMGDEGFERQFKIGDPVGQ